MKNEPVTLLTIDDETGLRHGIRDYFEDSGFNVLEAENGRTGLEIFRESKPDVILVDLRMPGIDGIEVIKAINQEAPETPVVVVSGTGVLADAIEAMRYGAWDYVTKPISDMVTLEHIVDRVLERARLLQENKHYQQNLKKLVAQKTADLQDSMVKLAERGEAFEHLAKGLVGLSGEDIYLRIIKACAAIFKTESTLLGLLVDEDKIETKAIMIENEMIPSFSFNFKDTPCYEIINNDHCLYRQGVRKFFPKAKLLDEFAVEGYIGVSLKDRQGETIGVLAVFSRKTINLPDHAKEVLDIIAARASMVIEQERTDQAEKQLQERLRQAQKMEAIGTLAGGIAHDFNNILSAILGYTEIAREESASGSTVDMDLEKVLEAANRAKDLVKQILAFSRQANSERITLQPASIVKEAIKMLRSSLPTTIEINQNITPGTGLVHADPTQIHQILMNLCTNAFHAMEKSGGRLGISLQETNLTNEDLAHEPNIEAGTFIQLSICDTGSGMAPEITDKIFDPYFSTKEVGKGTGMGLAIVHGIVKSHKGFISLSSEVGKGSVFHVFLPVSEKKRVPENETVDQVPIGRESILFIDDEEILALMGKDMLERLGYHVTVSISSLEALETFRNQPDQFDLVITDQTMPGMTGADLARHMMMIRPDIPIILCTGYSAIISEEKAKSMGIREFALKPLTKKDIATLIRKVLDTK